MTDAPMETTKTFPPAHFVRPRSEWGDGEWEGEPDKINWVDPATDWQRFGADHEHMRPSYKPIAYVRGEVLALAEQVRAAA